MKFSEEDKKTILNFYQAGLTVADICRILNLPLSTKTTTPEYGAVKYVIHKKHYLELVAAYKKKHPKKVKKWQQTTYKRRKEREEQRILQLREEVLAKKPELARLIVDNGLAASSLMRYTKKVAKPVQRQSGTRRNTTDGTFS